MNGERILNTEEEENNRNSTKKNVNHQCRKHTVYMTVISHTCIWCLSQQQFQTTCWDEPVKHGTLNAWAKCMKKYVTESLLDWFHNECYRDWEEKSLSPCVWFAIKSIRNVEDYRDYKLILKTWNVQPKTLREMNR